MFHAYWYPIWCSIQISKISTSPLKKAEEFARAPKRLRLYYNFCLFAVRFCFVFFAILKKKCAQNTHSI